MELGDAELLGTAAIALLALAFVSVQLRRALLFRQGATVACALRPCGKGWQGGVARFDPDALRAYRIVGVRWRPYAELDRHGFHVGGRRTAADAERPRLMADPVVLTVSAGPSRLELAVGRDALPGLLAWVEGRPYR